MNESLRSIILGTWGLTLAAAVSLVLTLIRRPVHARKTEWRPVTAVFVTLLVLQGLHAAEEYGTRFSERFPEALGLAPWPAGFFLIFNLTWLAIWMVAGFGLWSGSRLAFFPAWFLAIAGMANGVAHPVLAIREGGYFPGLLTSPLVGIGGIMLWRRLMAITKTNDGPGSP